MNSRITIAVPPDREHLVAEVSIETTVGKRKVLGEFFELNTENGELTVEIYNRDDGKDWVISFQDLMDLLQRAKKRLTGSE
jgi:hypothetical protein